MEDRVDRIISLIFATKRLLHEGRERKSEKTYSFLHLVTLSFVKKNKPLMKDVADYLGIAPPSATSLVNTLAKAHLIKRQVDVNDRRTVLIMISKKGEEYLELHKQKAMEMLRRNLERLTGEEQKQLVAILEKITKSTE